MAGHTPSKISENQHIPASSPLWHSSCCAPPSALFPGVPPAGGNADSPLGQPQNETLQSPSPDEQTCDGEQIRLSNLVKNLDGQESDHGLAVKLDLLNFSFFFLVH